MNTRSMYTPMDKLRAWMVLLGLVIHSAMSYRGTNDMSWPLHLKNNSVFLTNLVELIHAFRIPVFFFVSGIFGAKAYDTYGIQHVLFHRIRRIALPFIIFIILMNTIIVLSAPMLSSEYIKFLPTNLRTTEWSIAQFIPSQLYHLWFLYYLFLVSVFIIFLSYFLDKVTTKGLTFWVNKIKIHPILITFLLGITVFFIMIINQFEPFETLTHWTPNLALFLYYSLFYLTGWILFYRYVQLTQLKKFRYWFLLLGLFFFFILKQPFIEGIHGVKALIYAFMSVLLFMASLSFAFQNDAFNPILTYLARASYWIYILHFFIAIGFVILFDSIPISTTFKFIVVLFGSSGCSFLLYHLLIYKRKIDALILGNSTLITSK